MCYHKSQDVAFARQGLVELFLGESKLYRSQPEVLRGFFRVMAVIIAAESDRDLRALGSLDFKALHGSEEGLFQVGTDGRNRIRFRMNGREILVEAFGDFHS